MGHHNNDKECKEAQLKSGFFAVGLFFHLDTICNFIDSIRAQLRLIIGQMSLVGSPMCQCI